MGNSSLVCFINKDDIFSNIRNQENSKGDLVPPPADNLLSQSLVYAEEDLVPPPTAHNISNIRTDDTFDWEEILPIDHRPQTTGGRVLKKEYETSFHEFSMNDLSQLFSDGEA